MRKLLLAIISCAVLGCGGDRYEIVAVPFNGSLGGVVAYRLDKKTGDVLYIYDGKSRPVKPEPIDAQ